MIIKDDLALSFDDCLLVPRHFSGNSRRELDTGTKISNLELKFPIISANMPSVTGKEMCEKMAEFGGIGILHRSCTIEEQVEMVIPEKSGGAIGIGEDWKERAKALIDAGCSIICIDVAHGDQDRVTEITKEFFKEFGNFPLIVGNIATPSLPSRFNTDKDIEKHLEWITFKVGVGGGCFAAGTRILMSNGFYKNIEDVIPGEKVINKDGIPVTVKAKQKTGTKKVLSYKNNLWYEDTICTKDHKHWIGDLSSTSIKTLQSKGYVKFLHSNTKQGSSKFKWQEIGKDSQFCLLMPKNINFELDNDFEICLKKRDGGNGRDNQYRIDYKLKPSYNLGYVFGTFLGDGNSHSTIYNNSKRSSIHWTFGANEKEIAEKLKNCIFEIFNKEIKIEKAANKNIIKCDFYYKPFADFLEGFGKREEKHLPPALLVNNLEYLKGIYNGLIDSDGHIENKRKRLYNTSKKIIELFNVINYILYGYFPNNQMAKKSTGNLKGTNIDNIKDSFIAETLSKPKYRIGDSFQIGKILNKSQESEVEISVWDIEVDCPTHSFIANNAIVHNSVCTTRIQTGCGVPTLQSVIDCSSHFPHLAFIADGGIKNSGDVVKSLAAGAKAVMCGSLLAGTIESPGNIIKHQGNLMKSYYGNASYGGKRESRVKTDFLEGAETLVSYKGSSTKVLNQIRDGLQSGMSYCGAKTIRELHENAVFYRISTSGLRESMPHGLF